MDTPTTGGWYFQLLDKCHDITKKYDLPADITADIQRLAIEVARAQFKAGNKSGIEWLRKEMKTRRNVCPDCFAPDGEHTRASCNE